MLTLPPFSVVLDHFVHQRDVRIAPALRLANELWVASLVRAEEHHVEHRSGTDATSTTVRRSIEAGSKKNKIK